MTIDIFDTASLPSGEPDTLQAGDLVRWRRTDLSNTYDPTLYDLTYSARKAGAGTRAVEISITATSDATGFYIDESSTDTDDWEPGTYHWQAYITRKADSERIRVDYGRWQIMVNFDIGVGEDPRSHAEKMIDLIETALENRAGSDIIYYMIGGRAVSKIPPKELREMRDYYKAELAAEIDAERRANGLPTKNNLTVRFV